jgi:hypothetical protein
MPLTVPVLSRSYLALLALFFLFVPISPDIVPRAAFSDLACQLVGGSAEVKLALQIAYDPLATHSIQMSATDSN